MRLKPKVVFLIASLTTISIASTYQKTLAAHLLKDRAELTPFSIPIHKAQLPLSLHTIAPHLKFTQ